MRAFAFILGIIVLLVFLAQQFPYALSNPDNKMHAVYLSVLLIAISIGALSSHRVPIGETLRQGLLWLAIIMLLVLGYSYKNELLSSRLAAALIPNRALVNSEGNIVIRAREGGHFFVEAKVNGVPVNFMVDTGASDVSLSREDARRIGLDPDTLAYTRPYSTANGITHGAPVKLNRLAIGPFILDQFPASVNKGELSTSLLGMSALNALGGARFEGDEMVIGEKQGKAQ